MIIREIEGNEPTNKMGDMRETVHWYDKVCKEDYGCDAAPTLRLG